ncbi:hypothetical protein F5B18DRAFT_635612 [Nemania serpens]|nr:hypothetical protein F5B18DRAFT_635612 [Nemania serpens]
MRKWLASLVTFQHSYTYTRSQLPFSRTYLDSARGDSLRHRMNRHPEIILRSNTWIHYIVYSAWWTTKATNHSHLQSALYNMPRVSILLVLGIRSIIAALSFTVQAANKIKTKQIDRQAPGYVRTLGVHYGTRAEALNPCCGMA